jgi:hypothetical protein
VCEGLLVCSCVVPRTGRSFETEAQAAASMPSGMLVKGVRSMWRQSAPFLQRLLQTCLDRVLMLGDVPAAVAVAESEVREHACLRLPTCWQHVAAPMHWT